MTTLLEQARRRERERIQAIEEARATNRRLINERLGNEACNLARETFARQLQPGDLTFYTNDEGQQVTSFHVDEFTVNVCLHGQSCLFAITTRCPTCLATWTISRIGPRELKRLDSLLINNYAAHEWHDPRCPNYNPNVPEGLRGVDY